MRRTVSLALGAAGLVGGAVLALPSEARADNCPTTNAVYMSGSSAFAPVLGATQIALSALGTPANIIYQKPGSCEGLKVILGESGAMPTTDAHSANYFPNGVLTPCTLSDAGPASTTVDIGISDVYTETCQGTFDSALNSVGTTIGATVALPTKDFYGPIQAMTFAVPANSSANNISAEAAYMVFGFDASSAQPTIAPWTNQSHVYVRFWDSGTLEMLGAAIGLKGQYWANATETAASDGGVPMQQAGSSGTTSMVSLIQAAGATDPNGTIGIVGAANIYGANSAMPAPTVMLKPLAFQATGQSCAFYPDSSSSATDKLNVRQGRYDVWGPEHLVVSVDNSGLPVGRNNNTAAVQAVINALTATMYGPATMSSDAGSSLTETQIGSIIDLIAAPTGNGGVVPACAMEVSRTGEVGALSSYSSPYPCICRYESKASPTGGVHSHACTACTADSDCADAGTFTHCRYGYCEAN